VEDENGNTYEKQGTSNNWVNNIGNLRKTEGYKILVESNCTLDITGTPMTFPLYYNLKEGWNIISFPYNRSLNALEVVKPLIAEGILLKVQDERGRFIQYSEESLGWINTIGSFNPGEGYKMNVTKDTIIRVGESYLKSDFIIHNEEELSYFELCNIGNGVDHMNLVVVLDNSGLKAGNEIAAMDGNYCVGAVKLTDTDIQNNIVCINATFSYRDIENGFNEGNEIKLKTWDGTTTQQINQQIELLEGNLLYKRHESVIVKFNTTTDLSAFNTIGIDMYPNPAKDHVTIRFSEIPLLGTEIIITDVTGKQLIRQNALSTNEILDIHSFPLGIYLVRTQLENSYKIFKLIKK
jgi:hypothetical protein